MTFAFDARAAFVDPHRGFGRMVRELVPALAQLAAESLVVCVPAHASIPAAWYLWSAQNLKLRRPRRGTFWIDGMAWAWTARRYRFSCLHLPAWGVPAGVPVPVVATFHDATPLLFPTGLSWWQKKRVALGLASLRRATLVHTPSLFAKKQLGQLFPELEARAVVVFHGVHPRFQPIPMPTGDFLLGVGGGEQHKNWGLILEVYAQPQAHALPPLRLLGAVAKQARILRLVREKRLEERVLLSPDVDEATLVSAYQNAWALVFPSKNEGFGLPALEAMACGCPVFAANAGALPEVCGDAAVLLPPEDPKAWLAALVALHENPSLRFSLRQKGLARARQFTWEHAARELVDVYREAIRRASSAR
ncbi:MAG: glycosyltransferase family 4 protein [Thermoanaerobaculum sp.]